MADLTAFGSRLRRTREEKKMSQTQLGEALGTSQLTVVLWESGARKPRYQLLGKILEALSVPEGDRVEWMEDLTSGR